MFAVFSAVGHREEWEEQTGRWMDGWTGGSNEVGRLRIRGEKRDMRASILCSLLYASNAISAEKRRDEEERTGANRPKQRPIVECLISHTAAMMMMMVPVNANCGTDGGRTEISRKRVSLNGIKVRVEKAHNLFSVRGPLYYFSFFLSFSLSLSQRLDHDLDCPK